MLQDVAAAGPHCVNTPPLLIPVPHSNTAHCSVTFPHLTELPNTNVSANTVALKVEKPFTLQSKIHRSGMRFVSAGTEVATLQQAHQLS